MGFCRCLHALVGNRQGPRGRGQQPDVIGPRDAACSPGAGRVQTGRQATGPAQYKRRFESFVNSLLPPGANPSKVCLGNCVSLPSGMGARAWAGGAGGRAASLGVSSARTSGSRECSARWFRGCGRRRGMAASAKGSQRAPRSRWAVSGHEEDGHRWVTAWPCCHLPVSAACPRPRTTPKPRAGETVPTLLPDSHSGQEFTATDTKLCVRFGAVRAPLQGTETTPRRTSPSSPPRCRTPDP